ncbi:MAG: cobalt-zinc-cadmium efflux system protein [Acidimicrobiaceae bacterium]|jgi:cobalt-zinc-cadmium efflux system protein
MVRHDHAHHAVVRAGQRGALLVALIVNTAFLIAEIAGGIAFHSLALLADAAHMFTDVAALAIALVALTLTSKPSTARLTFGLERAEVLGALVNGLTLLAASGWIVFEALHRMGSPADVDGGGVLIVAAVGIVINLVSAVVLLRTKGRSLNMQGALVHMVTDAIGLAGTFVAALAVLLWDSTWADPVASLAIALLVLYSGFRLLADTVHVLLEGTPSGMDRSEVESTLLDEDGVEAVHHLHLWSLASDVPALSAHVVLAGEVSLHEAQQRGEELKHVLAMRHGIVHATLELECHACEDDVH